MQKESVGAIVSGLKQAGINFFLCCDSDLLCGETIQSRLRMSGMFLPVILGAYRLKGVRRRISEWSIPGRGSYAIHI